MSKMWSGRFQEESSSLLEEFNASIDFDKELFDEDIDGSIAHAKMLGQSGILKKDEVNKIEIGLMTIRKEIENNEFEFKISDEDIHMSIEKRLTELIGEAGKKLHTARSRNDQVALDFRLYTLKKSKILKEYLLELIGVFLDLSAQHKQTLIPGMTHLQHAQPISFSFHMLAYASMFKRDYERFESSIERNNYSPLGSAALAGTPHKIDRNYTAKALGFYAPTLNALDSVSDRDFALEVLFNISTMMMHMSRLCEELIIWSCSEFNFVSISDKYSTGSSIMPQKKNPDVAELIRGKTGRVNGNLISLLTVMKGLPLAYNKDMQEDKESVFDSIKTADISIRILTDMLRTLSVKKDRMREACKIGHLSATDLADYLVRLGIPFREAHFITGKAVALAESEGIDLSEMSTKSLMNIDSRITEDVLPVLDLNNSMNARKSEGGTSVESVEKQIEYFKKWLISKSN